MNTYPLCFESSEQYQLWKQAARQYSDDLSLSGYCVDCTPDYQGKMIRAGRCEFPATTFAEDKEGFICGTRSVEDKRVA